MRPKEFFNKIDTLIKTIKKEKKEAINKGNRELYQCLCNQLKGINEVMFRIKRVKIFMDFKKW